MSGILSASVRIILVSVILALVSGRLAYLL